jgi:hypothetical protein
MYVYPQRLLGRKRIRETPHSHGGSDEYLTPKSNPEGIEAALGFSDGM